MRRRLAATPLGGFLLSLRVGGSESVELSLKERFPNCFNLNRLV